MTDLLASGNLGGSCLGTPWPTLGGRGGGCGLLLEGSGEGGGDAGSLEAEGSCVSTNCEGLFLLGVILGGGDPDVENIVDGGAPAEEGGEASLDGSEDIPGGSDSL